MNIKTQSTIFITLFLSVFGAICAQAQIKDCRVLPRHLSKSGFDASKSALSTSENKKMGLCYVEFNENGENKIYQHPTWRNAGYLSAMIINEKGEIFLAPTPVINTLYNKIDAQNTIYKIDATSGELKKWLDLPKGATPNSENPYGLIGLAYDCESRVLYASSVMGSNKEKEHGVVYAINTDNATIIGKIEELDAMGLGVIQKNNQKRLMIGSARSGVLQSIELGKDGTFIGAKTIEFSLENMGPRGDDIARKIRMTPDGILTISGIEFYFNLTAPTEKQESKYSFRYMNNQNKWQLMQIQ